MLPGTANTSRFCSIASRAVINEPEFSAASTITTPKLNPLITRLHQCSVLTIGRTSTRADDCDTGPFETIGPGAPNVQDDRWIVSLAQQRRINAVVEHQDVAAKLTHAFNLGLSARLQLAVGNALDTLRRQPQQGQLSTRRIEDRFCRSEVFQETSRHAWPYAGSHVESDPIFHRFQNADCGMRNS